VFCFERHMYCSRQPLSVVVDRVGVFGFIFSYCRSMYISFLFRRQISSLKVDFVNVNKTSKSRKRSSGGRNKTK